MNTEYVTNPEFGCACVDREARLCFELRYHSGTSGDPCEKCLNSGIPLICAENPIQHKYARSFIRKYDQIIQPHYFGDNESKAICLWLVGLPKLVRTHFITESEIRQSVWKESPGPERKANRSRNFPGISNAMASQWGSL